MPNVFSGPFIHKTLAGFGVWCCLFFLPNVVQSTTSNSSTLQWAANLESDLAGYRIYHGTAPGVYGYSQTVGKTTTYQYTNLEPSKTHYFTITAYDTSGNESLPSPEVSKYIANSSGSGPAPPLDRGGWGVWVDSEETAQEQGQGTNIKDGNNLTHWHTQWSGATTPLHPHHLVVDLGAVATIGGFTALPRQDTGVNGRIGQWELYVKTNSATPPTQLPTNRNPAFPPAGEWILVDSGTFLNNANLQTVILETAQTSRYVWLKVLTEAQGTNNPWTSLAEFNVLGTFESGILPLEVSPAAATVFTGGQQQFGGTNGVPPFTFSVLAGDTTGGASITPTGLYTAGPNAGTSTIRITDGAMPPAIAQATVTVLDVTPPSISLISPTNGSMLSGKIAINATATDNSGVTGVQFQLNGNNLGAEDTTSPFSISWDSSGVVPGLYTLTAIARDAAGNTTSSVPVTISISSPPSTLTLSIAGSGSVTSSPDGIRCTSGICSASYGTGSAITLTAKANKKWTFSGWSGACSGTGECVVQLSANQVVGATFSQNGNGRRNK